MPTSSVLLLNVKLQFFIQRQHYTQEQDLANALVLMSSLITQLNHLTIARSRAHCM